MLRPQTAVDADGHVTKGTVLEDKAELLRVLEAWLRTSDAPTLGDGSKRGQTPWLFITLGQYRRGVLNADTKRAAVEEYVADTQTRGARIPWSVIRNSRNHKWNKLVF